MGRIIATSALALGLLNPHFDMAPAEPVPIEVEPGEPEISVEAHEQQRRLARQRDQFIRLLNLSARSGVVFSEVEVPRSAYEERSIVVTSDGECAVELRRVNGKIVPGLTGRVRYMTDVTMLEGKPMVDGYHYFHDRLDSGVETPDQPVGEWLRTGELVIEMCDAYYDKLGDFDEQLYGPPGMFGLRD